MDGPGIGVIGTGFMGKCHALAFRAVGAVFEGTPAPRLEMLADVDHATVERCGRAWGFTRWITDWRALVADPSVDVVAITTPNFLHQEMALAAIAAGKHVYCEKPLALDAAGAQAVAEAAEAVGVTTLIGPDHPPYASFCPAPGHQLGFNELKVIEVKALLDAIAGEAPADPDFRAGHEIARVIEAIQISAAGRRWVRPADV